MHALCLVTFTPNKVWCDFLNLFSEYKIFMIVDDNKFDLYEFISNYNNINFIQIEDINCNLNGYTNTNFTLNKKISGWDKALYYFGVENNIYDFIWFLEDDVFFNNEDTLLQIDSQYINDDLLSNNYEINVDGNKNTWHWAGITINYSPPYYNGMMCAVRFSNRMMKSINNYAKNQNELFFLEALFPTVAIKNELKCNTPNEMKNISYRNYFDDEDISEENLYHPVKDLDKHIYFRTRKNPCI
jgi:hypothetical protein